MKQAIVLELIWVFFSNFEFIFMIKVQQSNSQSICHLEVDKYKTHILFISLFFLFFKSQSHLHISFVYACCQDIYMT